MHVLCGCLHIYIFFLKSCERITRAQNPDVLALACTCMCLCMCCFCGASALPELQATFAGGCLLITAINLPADSGLERHVAAPLREGKVVVVLQSKVGGTVEWEKNSEGSRFKKMPSSTHKKPHTGTKKKKKASHTDNEGRVGGVRYLRREVGGLIGWSLRAFRLRGRL